MTYAVQVIRIDFMKTRINYSQAFLRNGRAMFTSHPSASQAVSMFINLLVKLSLTILFLLFYFIHIIIFINKIDIVICNVAQYGDMDLGCVRGFEDYEYTV